MQPEKQEGGWALWSCPCFTLWPPSLSLTWSKKQQGPLASGWAGWGEGGLFASGFGWRGARPGPHLETLIVVNLLDGDAHRAEPEWLDR